jgi:hypothetical protein
VVAVNESSTLFLSLPSFAGLERPVFDPQTVGHSVANGVRCQNDCNDQTAYQLMTAIQRCPF